MAHIDRKTIDQIASLARLSLTEDEAVRYQQELSGVLKHFEEIAQINTDNVEPLMTPTEVATTWREDAVVVETTAEQIVENAPQKTGNLFTVPPVV